MLMNICFLVTVSFCVWLHSSHAQDNGVQPIAFSLGQNAHIHVTDGATIQFNKIITALGQTADLQTSGRFICPAEGIYKFQVYSLTHSDKRIWLELYLNQDLVASLYGHTPNDFADAGNAVILHLNRGDVVSVKSHNQYDVTLFGTPNEIYTTFSGVQIVSSFETENTYYDSVAFSTTLTTHMIFNPGSTILYDTMLLNEGNGYNNDTGVFTAPAPGIYLFHFFSLAENNEKIWQELYHNSDYVCSLYGLTSSYWADAGNTAILHLKLGDTVQVKSRQTSKLFGSADEIYSSFSGVLISGESSLDPGSTQMIAFSAGLSSSTTVAANSKVVFDRIFINIQHAYDQHTGEFTAPTQGVYEFNVHALGQYDQSIWLELYHNYKYVVSLYSHTPSQYGPAGNAAILQLDTGDVVYVKAHRDSALFGANDEVYCTFSGYRIARTYTGLPVIG
ncbi:hypothetical protein ACJMK2_007190 [Sinanodonta woodiana]|uniref:C1q domain-containing protein n=1 Tax=Sinanodonta woodiana TaxID=1069815 RepID=A0ABD3VIW1_SINWO